MLKELKATRVFQETYQALKDPKIRIIVNQGGSRSSKTYSIAQVFMILMYEERNEIMTVVRKTLPALKASAMRDFLSIVKEQEVYSEDKHNKTELTYHENGNELEFIAVDQPQKIRGRKRKYLWANEANELSYEDFQQLILRTTGKLFLDYNPSDEFHWIYDKVLTRDDCKFIQSTYLDNPFLDKETVKEIERLKTVDQNYWRIYGLGERGISESSIYTHWQFCDELPGEIQMYGLDFGYNHPTSLTGVNMKDDDVYARELIYETHLTGSDFIDRMNSDGISKEIPMYADAEDPQRIEEIKRAGFNIIPATKGKGSVKNGIDAIKARGFYITKDSVNGLKEVKSYRWIVKNEQNTDEPVKVNDDFCDSLRYAVFSHLQTPVPGMYFGVE